MAGSLADKVAVITGASAGIGAALARELSGAGARLVLTARRADRLQALQLELPTDVATLAADIGNPGTPERLLDLAVSHFGRADILINNAGILAFGPVDSVDLDELSQMIRINFEALVRATYVFARAFKAQRDGSIINVSSIGAYVTSPTAGVYGGLKHAVEAFTNALRLELSGTGVRLGTVAPGTTRTEIFAGLRARGERGWDEYTTPIEAQDVATAVRFMLEQPEHVNVARLLVVSAAELV